MTTTIQISDSIKQSLNRMKMVARESYNEVIEKMIEDNLELNEKTKKEIDEARKQIREGKVVSHEEIKKRYEL